MPQSNRALSSHFAETALSSDLAFDSLYDERIRLLSEQHWTPVGVAMRAARLLTQAGATRILDVGSGAGKFCIAGALSTSAEFVGVERREHLITVARNAAFAMNASRATFVHSNIDAFPFDDFSGVYLYNPFFEQISAYLVQIDNALERSPTTYRYFVETTLSKLSRMASGTAVVAFNGFGGQLSRGFSFEGDEPAGNDRLELWIKD